VEHGLRASDADRQHVVAALERHTSAGRLNLDEFAERVDRVLAARTQAELHDLIGDLPTEPTGPGAADTDVDHIHLSTGARQLALAFLIALLTLVLLGVVLAAVR
jgi:hypothetical protein